MSVCVCVRACVRVYVCVRARVCTSACVRARVCTCACVCVRVNVCAGAYALIWYIYNLTYPHPFATYAGQNRAAGKKIFKGSNPAQVWLNFKNAAEWLLRLVHDDSAAEDTGIAQF